MNVDAMVDLLLYLLLGAAVIVVVYFILRQLDLPPDVKSTITLVFAVLVIVWLIYTLAPGVAP